MRPAALASIASALLLGACGPSLMQVDVGAPLSDADLAMGWARGGNRSTSDFSEQVVLRAELDDGGNVYAKFVVSNIAGADGRGQFSLDVKTGDGRRFEWREKADRGDWTFDTDRLRIEIGAAIIDVGVGKAQITIDGDGATLQLDIASGLPPLRPPGGRLEQGGLFYVTTLPIPRGSARLQLTVSDPELWLPAETVEEPAPREPAPSLETAAPSETPVADAPEIDAPENEAPPDDAIEPASDETPTADGASEPEADAFEDDGIAYVEHRWGNVPPYELAQRWYNLRVIGTDETVVMSAFERPLSVPDGQPRPGPETRGAMHGWMFAARDDGLVMYGADIDVRPYGWSTDDVTSYHLPAIIYVSDKAGRELRGVLDLGPLSQRKDDLAALKKIERIVVRRFMQPWTFGFHQARFLFRWQLPGETALDSRGRGRFQFQQIRE
jgi:hypothetical protein